MKPTQYAILWALCLPASIFAIAECEELLPLIGIKFAAVALFYAAYRLMRRWEKKGKLHIEE